MLYNFAAGGNGWEVCLCGESRFFVGITSDSKFFHHWKTMFFEKCPFCAIRKSERRAGRKSSTIHFVAAYKIEANWRKNISRLEVYPSAPVHLIVLSPTKIRFSCIFKMVFFLPLVRTLTQKMVKRRARRKNQMLSPHGDHSTSDHGISIPNDPRSRSAVFSGQKLIKRWKRCFSHHC